MSSLTRYQENDTFLADIFSPLVGIDQLLEVAGKKTSYEGLASFLISQLIGDPSAFEDRKKCLVGVQVKLALLMP